MVVLTNNPTCQHLNPDVETYRCLDCDEPMIGVEWESESVLSAPNAAPCTNPEHLEAIAAGRDFECHQVYVPDMDRAVEVQVAIHYRFICKRCDQGDTIIDRHGIHWDCGRDHRATRPY